MQKIYKIALVWALGLFLLSYVGSLTFPKIANTGLGSPSATQNFNYFLSLAQWDGGNYVEIAKTGYQKNSFYAFAPLYPTLIGILNKTTKIDPVLIGVLISVASFFAFIYFFHKFTQNLYDKKIADTTLLTFLFFPTTFFCLLLYSESLFLLFMSLSMYFYSKKNYVGAIITTALLPLVRYVGVFLTLGFLVQSAAKKNINLTIALLLSFSPFLVYTAVIYSIFADPLYFVSTQSLWSRFALDPISTVFIYILPILNFSAVSLGNLADLATTITFIGIIAYGIRILPKYLWIFSLLAILIPASTGSLIGMPRYALISLGAFIAFAHLLSAKPQIKAILWPLSLALQVVLLSLFITGHWIA